ncbi:universal stress protein [Peribacillus glennii]|uniref:Universal stress protein n=1 Tax=Peribacillus glennii TaxID=2303991 RepID=A0A372LI57_9BACI|nr:universal stress protein [Peribacillus glennii]RFU65995.1 universal stress protein [Peribacillus glennii]
MTTTYKKILVAVDGSEEADRAFKKAVEISKRNDAEIVLGHVIDTRNFPTIEAYDLTIRDRTETFANELIEKYKAEAAEAGIKEITIDIEVGNPKVKIAKDMAKKHWADLIICGATGLNAIERIMIGSVSEHITRYARCDVLVIRSEKELENLPHGEPLSAASIKA